jgi:LEA14-like dessication related protein
MSSARPLLCFVLPAALALSACSKPEPPTVTPLSGRVTAISPAGIDVEAKLEAENPNGFDISVKSFTATITLDRQYQAGTVTSTHPVTLPAEKKRVFDLPLSVKWTDALALAPLALSNRDVSWDADMKVTLNGGGIDVELPFKLSGVLTHAQIMQAVGRSLPKIQGLSF